MQALISERATEPRTRQQAGRDVVVITGSSGFIGQALIRRLAERYDLVGLDFALPPHPVPQAETVRVDLTSDSSVNAALARVRAAHGARIASVIHLAGYYDLSGDSSPKYEAVTVRGTERLLRALDGFDVEQFVFTSTMLVHGPTKPRHPINEDAPLHPKTPYPQSKLQTENVIAERHGDIPVVILRLAGVYDERCHAAFLAQQIANIYERQLVSYIYPGDVAAGQPYLHIDDLAEAIERLIARRDRLPPQTTLLLGEPETMSYDDVQKAVGRLLHGEEWETKQVPKLLAKTGQWLQEDVLDLDPFIQPWMIDQASDHYELDLGRSRKLLGWEPEHRLRQTLPAMTAALKADPTGWYAANKLNAAVVAEDQPAAQGDHADAQPASAEVLAKVDRELGESHRRTLWAHFTNAMLGFWLISSPFMYGLFDPPVAALAPPAAGHELAPPHVRDFRLGLSEIASGTAIVLLSIIALGRTRTWAQWAIAAIGAWLLFAPLVFWTTSAAAYAGDTLVGMLTIMLAVMIPEQPGISRQALASAGDVPLGWTYSPSSYVQRIPIVALAFVGLFISRYLAAFQLGHIPTVWDGFFAGLPGTGNGTEAVITSAVSKAFPIADAGFGAVAYALDILTGAIGDRRRWRTMPWLVLVFGLLIVPLGMVSVGFIIIQPPVIGTLCTLCLVQAAITIALVPYSIDEVIATVQYLLQRKRAGHSLWRSLIFGGPALQEVQGRSEDLRSVPAVAAEFLRGGVTYPWTLVACIALGICLIATPALLGSSPPLSHSDHVAGCLMITIAVTAMAEVARAVRLLNLPIGLWVAASPLLLDGGGGAAILLNTAAGLSLVLLSLPRGTPSREHYGSWDRLIV